MSRYIDIEPYERKPGGDIKEHTCRIEVKTVFNNGFGTVHEQRVKTEDIPTADILTQSDVNGIWWQLASTAVATYKLLERENADLRKAIKTMQEENASPVIESEWVVHYDDLFPMDSDMTCKRCGESQPIIISDNFCPHCGARMKNGEACEDAEKAKSKKVRTDKTEMP